MSLIKSKRSGSRAPFGTRRSYQRFYFRQLAGHQTELVGLHYLFGRPVLRQGVVKRRLLVAEAEFVPVPLRLADPFSQLVHFP